MPMIENQPKSSDYQATHGVIMENREKLTISGVNDVETFDENTVIIHTVMGLMTICGSGLHIRELNVDTSDLNIEGNIDSIEYRNETYEKKRGLFQGIFR